LIAALSVSGCVGVTGAGTPAATNNPGSSSGTLAANATSFSFGNVNVGSSATQTLTLTNSGAAAVTISQAAVTGAEFSIVGGMSSVLIPTGQSHDFQIQFSPRTAGAATGSVSVSSNATDSMLAVAVTGMGMGPLSITAQPSNETVTAGQAASFAVGAAGTGTLTYQWKKNGTAISGATSASYTTPATVNSDSGEQFVVVVSDGSASLTSNGATLTVAPATFVLNANKASLSFSSVSTGSSSMLPVTFTNAGNSNVTISNVSMTGSGFTAGGMSSGLILTPGQTAALDVTFAPAAAGSVTGSATVTSNAASSPIKIALSGIGVQAVVHSVTLGWNADTSAVAGYRVYRSTASGGPYTVLTSSPLTATSYVDLAVQSGKTYFYVATAVDSAGAESPYAPEISATIP